MMALEHSQVEITTDKDRLQRERVLAMLKTTYWAKDRPRERVEASIESSLCFGVFVDGVQTGFARVITDYSTTYYLCDVVIDEAYRGQGLGKKLIVTIVNDKRLRGLYGILLTNNASGFYEKAGFSQRSGSLMDKRP